MAMKERDAVSFSGWFALLIGLGSLAAAIAVFAMIKQHQQEPGKYLGAGIGLVVFGLVMLSGCMVIGPNEARVMTFFGRYTGSEKTPGLRWINPFTNKRQISLRARTFE